MKKKQRRILAGFLIGWGAVLLFIASETWGGIAVEITGIALEKK